MTSIGVEYEKTCMVQSKDQLKLECYNHGSQYARNNSNFINVIFSNTFQVLKICMDEKF